MRGCPALLLTAVLVLVGRPLWAQCAGDLDGNGRVTVDEVLTVVNAALSGCGVPPAVASCPGDLDGSGSVTIGEILQAVNAALAACPQPTRTPVALTATPTATVTLSATPTPSPTDTPVSCPYTFLDNTLQNASCDYLGPFNADPSCPTDLEAIFAGEGVLGGLVGVGLNTTPDIITFVGTVTSATSATLLGYTIGNDTTVQPAGGTVELQQNGQVLIIAPDTATIDIIADTGQCAFVQYAGSYVGVLSAGVAPPLPLAARIQPAAFRFR